MWVNELHQVSISAAGGIRTLDFRGLLKPNIHFIVDFCIRMANSFNVQLCNIKQTMHAHALTEIIIMMNVVPWILRHRCVTMSELRWRPKSTVAAGMQPFHIIEFSVCTTFVLVCLLLCFDHSCSWTLHVRTYDTPNYSNLHTSHTYLHTDTTWNIYSAGISRHMLSRWTVLV